MSHRRKRREGRPDKRSGRLTPKRETLSAQAMARVGRAPPRSASTANPERVVLAALHRGGHNVVAMGPVGVGKTFLATALAMPPR